MIFQMKLGQATRQFQIIQRVFHNKILNTKTAELTQGTFSALQLAHDHVTLCIQKVERLQEVSLRKIGDYIYYLHWHYYIDFLQAFKNVSYLLGGSIRCTVSLLSLGRSSEKKRIIGLFEKALLPVEQLDMDQVTFSLS